MWLLPFSPLSSPNSPLPLSFTARIQMACCESSSCHMLNSARILQEKFRIIQAKQMIHRQGDVEMGTFITPHFGRGWKEHRQQSIKLLGTGKRQVGNGCWLLLQTQELGNTWQNYGLAGSAKTKGGRLFLSTGSGEGRKVSCIQKVIIQA